MSAGLRAFAEWFQIALWVAFAIAIVFTSRLDRWFRGDSMRFTGSLFLAALGVTSATYYADEAFYWSQTAGGFLIGVGYAGMIWNLAEREWR